MTPTRNLIRISAFATDARGARIRIYRAVQSAEIPLSSVEAVKQSCALYALANWPSGIPKSEPEIQVEHFTHWYGRQIGEINV